MHTIFGVWDYVVFGFTLFLSALIGFYFGCFGTKQKSTAEYLYGNGKMKAIPVGLSLYSSAVSAVSIIGTPAEVYVFGTQFLFVSLGSILSLILTWLFVIPVFTTDLGIKMPYEYFELRFNNKVRVMSSFIYILHVVIYLPIVLYASTIAFSELSALPLLACTTLVGGVCVLYTMIGGFNSVIWTDTLQATLMMGSCLVVMIMGINKVGGFSEMWNIGEEGGRIILFNMDPNPLARLTFWSATIGMGITFASHSGCSASTLQRYMSLPGEKEARISSFIGAVGFSILTIITGLMGLSMYAIYHGCDPEKNKDIQGSNQLVPYFISDTIGTIPGFAGFFIAGLLSAGLSTLSAEFNTVAGLLYHDFVKKIYKKPISDANGAKIMKLLVLILGILCLLSVPIIQKSKHIFQFGLMLGGLTYGTKLATLLLGTSFPRANSTGVLWGNVASVAIVTWISFGAMYYSINEPYVLPTSVDNCPAVNFTGISNMTLSNITTTVPLSLISEPEQSEPFFLLKLSFMYYPLFGALVTMVVGLAVSYLTKADEKKLDPKLIVPIMQSFIPTHQDASVLQTMLDPEINEKNKC